MTTPKPRPVEEIAREAAEKADDTLRYRARDEVVTAELAAIIQRACEEATATLKAQIAEARVDSERLKLALDYIEKLERERGAGR